MSTRRCDTHEETIWSKLFNQGYFIQILPWHYIKFPSLIFHVLIFKWGLYMNLNRAKSEVTENKVVVLCIRLICVLIRECHTHTLHIMCEDSSKYHTSVRRCKGAGL